MSEQVKLFGCQIDRMRMPDAVARVYDLVNEKASACQYVVTPNVQHVVMLRHHEGLQHAYKDASLVLADGMPIILASRLLRRELPERVTGADLVPAVLAEAQSRGGLRVYLLGAAAGVAERAAANITKRWPSVTVCGTYSPPFGFENDPLENAAILKRIAECKPDVLVVGLGAPKQELWVHKHRNEIAASVALCAGAVIDFLSGGKSRAPRWMQKSGLEWMHRIVTEPRRLLGRYVRDAWHFPQLIWREWRSQSADA